MNRHVLAYLQRKRDPKALAKKQENRAEIDGLQYKLKGTI